MGGSQECSSSGSVSLLPAEAGAGAGSQQVQQWQALLPAKAGEETQTVGAVHGRPTLCSATVGGIGIVLVLLSRNTSPVKDSQEEAKRNWSVQVSETKERYHRDLYIEPTGVGHRAIGKS